MNCETAKTNLLLYEYGELSFEEEEMIEQHLAGCEDCRAERERIAKASALLEQGVAEVPAGLLSRCRQDLSQRVSVEKGGRGFSIAAVWRNWVVNPPMWLRPVGALAMLAIGFFAAQVAPSSPALAKLTGTQEQAPVVSRIRFVNPDQGGRVRVLYDETRQRELSGELNDDRIRRLLLTAAADPADPGLRVESIDFLMRHSSDDEVRKALMNALRTDSNSGVRLKALEGLRSYVQDPEIRKVLAQVLLTDSNPGIRTQAVDLLIQSKQPDLAGVLQESLRREDNGYVRSRSQKALSDMKASVGTF